MVGGRAKVDPETTQNAPMLENGLVTKGNIIQEN